MAMHFVGIVAEIKCHSALTTTTFLLRETKVALNIAIISHLKWPERIWCWRSLCKSVCGFSTTDSDMGFTSQHSGCGLRGSRQCVHNMCKYADIVNKRIDVNWMTVHHFHPLLLLNVPVICGTVCVKALIIFYLPACDVCPCVTLLFVRLPVCGSLYELVTGLPDSEMPYHFYTDQRFALVLLCVVLILPLSISKEISIQKYIRCRRSHTVYTPPCLSLVDFIGFSRFECCSFCV